MNFIGFVSVMDSEIGMLTAGRDKTARVWSLHSQVVIISEGVGETNGSFFKT